MVSDNYSGFPAVLVVKESICQDSGELGSILRLGIEPLEEGMATHFNPFQYSCLENPMDRGAWRAIVLGLQRVVHN